MRRSLCLFAVVILTAASLVSAQTVDEILAKHYEARGGIDKIRSVESARREGTITMSPSAPTENRRWHTVMASSFRFRPFRMPLRSSMRMKSFPLPCIL